MDTFKLYEKLIERKKQVSQDGGAGEKDQKSGGGKSELQLIENALYKMEHGDLGVCEKCGKDIDEQRLESIPWTAFCFDCDKQQDYSRNTVQNEGDSGVFEEESDNLSEMTDVELQEFLFEQIQEENRIDVFNLQITVQDKIVYLEGEMSNEVQYQTLLSIIKEYVDPEDIVDNIGLQGEGWEDDSDFEDMYHDAEDDMLSEKGEDEDWDDEEF